MYLNQWSDYVDMVRDFEEQEHSYGKEKPTESICKPEEVLFANYGCGSYEGEAFVLFQRDGKLYEVNGSHCSCYGLEGQWQPEETTIQVLLHRIDKGDLGKDQHEEEYNFSDQLIPILRKYSNDQ